MILIWDGMTSRDYAMSFLEILKYGARFAIPSVAPQIKAISNVYEFTPTDQFEDGGIEWEITLNSKPSAIGFAVQFQASDLVFHYQPPLTEELDPVEYDLVTETEAWKDGERIVYRPANIAGSYAAYHSYKRNNEFKCGKLFHLCRPHLVDAVGAEAWATLNIKGNTLTVVLPEQFLDSAVYPITVDPTFGKTDKGGTQYVQWEDRLEGSKFTLSEQGIITKVTVYGKKSSGSFTGKIVIYASTLGKEAETQERVIIAPFDGELDFTFSSNPTLNAGDYWLTLHSSNDAIAIYYDAGGSNQWMYDLDEYDDGPPDPLNPENYEDWEETIYATYTATSGMSGGVMGGHYYAASGIMTKIRRG